MVDESLPHGHPNLHQLQAIAYFEGTVRVVHCTPVVARGKFDILRIICFGSAKSPH